MPKSRGLFIVFKGKRSKRRLLGPVAGRAAPYVWKKSEVRALAKRNPRVCYKLGNIDTQRVSYVGACRRRRRKR